MSRSTGPGNFLKGREMGLCEYESRCVERTMQREGEGEKDEGEGEEEEREEGTETEGKGEYRKGGRKDRERKTWKETCSGFEKLILQLL